MHRLIITLLLKGLKLSRCLACLFLDVSEELEEVLSVFLEHLLGADETELAHFVEVGEALDLLVLLLEEHLDEEHLSLLLDQIPTILSVFRPLNRHVEASVLCDVDFVSDVGVDGQSSRLNVCLAELAEAAFPRRPILLPNLELLVCLSLLLFSGALLVLERENAIIARVNKRIRMLLEAKERLGALAASIAASLVLSSCPTSIQTGTALAHLAHLKNSNLTYVFVLLKRLLH